MWSVFLTRFQTRWPDAAWVPASDLTGALRIRKDAGEVALLRSAAEAVDRVMTAIPGKVGFRGRTEKAIGRDLAELLVAEGHDEAMFTIVASGPNGASPHHDPGQRVVEPGDLIVCDIGGRIGGYYSDCTRTFVVGDPAPEPSEAHAAVLAAGEAGKAAIRPGVACQEVDRAARQVITDAGLGDYFIHRTGHGIGLEVHEDPYMVEGNEAVIEPGMAFSVEPGVYLPGRFGVRIEDIVVCDELVADVLNSSTRDLMPVG
jgi:Xaa-Pro aminopeptidase